MKHWKLSAVPAAALLLLAAACQSAPDEPDPVWRTCEVVASSDRVVWKITLLALEKQGYPLASGLDPSSLVATTGWRTDLAPFSNEGYRTRAEVELQPVGPGRWGLKARVKKQVNKSLARPLDLSYAEWEWVADDDSAAEILLQHIRSRLDPEIQLRDEPDDPIEAYLEGRKDGSPD